MPRALTVNENAVVVGKRQSVKPEYYNATLNSMQSIGPDFENYVCLLPKEVAKQIKSTLNSLNTDTADRKARGTLASNFITNSKTALSARSDVYSKEAVKVNDLMAKASSGPTILGDGTLTELSDAPEAGYMMEDLRLTQAEVIHHYTQYNYLALSMDTSAKQWEDSEVSQDRRKQIKSFGSLITLYTD